MYTLFLITMFSNPYLIKQEPINLMCGITYTLSNFTVLIDPVTKKATHRNLVTDQAYKVDVEITDFEAKYSFTNQKGEVEHFRIGRRSLGVSHSVMLDGEQVTGGYGGCEVSTQNIGN